MKLNIEGNKPLYLMRDPLLPMEAATKGYVDTSVSTHATDTSLHITSGQNTWLDSITASTTEINYLVGVSSSVQTQLNSKLALAGGTMTGSLYLSADPVNLTEATTKNYVDNASALKVAKAGDVMTGLLELSGAPTTDLHAATKKYVDDGISGHAGNAGIHLTSGQNTWIDAITATSTEVNYLEGVSSSVQTQLNSKLALAGGTLTGFIVLHAAPTDNLHAATKKYVDDGLGLKLNLAGGTLTGALELAADPTTTLQASTKGYVDSSLSTHATDAALHLTSGQNTWIDAITVSSTEVNYLASSTGNIQSQLDAKFDKTGGTVSGDITLSTGKAVFVSKTPDTDNELVNKAYVDAKVNGKDWKDPVSAINLISTTLSAPPVSPVVNDSYIVGPSATGAWVGKEGYVTTYVGTAWVFIQTRAVIAGDRFGVTMMSATTLGSDLTGKAKQLVTLVSGTPGNYVWLVDTLTAGATTLVFDQEAPDFGVSYTYTDGDNWTPTNTSVNITAGNGLQLDGNMLNVVPGDGIKIVNDTVTAKINTASGLFVNGTGEVDFAHKSTDFQITASGLTFNSTVRSTLDDVVTKSADSVVTANLSVSAAGSLRVANQPTVDTDVANKLYVTTTAGGLQTSIDTINTTLTTLNTDPVTKAFVNSGLAEKVAKAGDTMTGFLTLSADPSSNLHAATKAYVDSTVSGHSTDAGLHLTSGQNTWFDAITATSDEVNYLSGVTSGVQTQLDTKLPKAGGTMTGEIVLAGSPSNVLGAVPKQDLTDGLAAKVAKAGDAMTGFLELSGAPTADLHASTKKYVDDTAYTHASNFDLHLTSGQNTWIDAITATSAEVNYLAGTTSAVQTQLDAKVALSGSTMTGHLFLNADPSANLHAATKKYVDDGLVLKLNLAGGTLTGALVLAGTPTISTEAANKGYVDTEITTAKGYTDTEAAKKVAKAGDTMTGFLTLSAAPTADLHASTKKYVDDGISGLNTTIGTSLTTITGNVTTLRGDVDGLLADPVTKNYVDTQDNTKLPKAGGTLTGYITLHADPMNAMHAVTKQYVDALAQGLTTKPSVRFATTANLSATYNNGTFGVASTLTASTNGVLTVDGGTPLVGDRILVRTQTTPAENGDYTVQQVGDVNTPYILKRVSTVDESSEVPGSYFYVYDGATLKGTGWTFTVANPVTFSIGNDGIDVNQFSGQGNMVAGTGMTLTGNTFNVNTANPARIVINADDIDLATTGVTPGTYTKVVTDGYGRITSGSNPNTLAGYGIADAQNLNANLTSLSGVTTAGILVRTSTDELATRKLSTSGVGISVNNDATGNPGTDLIISSNATSSGTASTIVSRDVSGDFTANQITANLTGNASTATVLQTTRTFSVSGDVTATAVNFNGAANVELATVFKDSGVTAGDYTKVTVSAKGIVTAGTNPTTISGYGITDAYTKTETDAKIALLEATIFELQAYIMSRI